MENKFNISIIKQARKSLGITRNEFCQLLGISISSMNHWEYSGCVPPLIYQDVIKGMLVFSEIIKERLRQNKNKYLSMYLSNSSGAMELLISAVKDVIEDNMNRKFLLKRNELVEKELE